RALRGEDHEPRWVPTVTANNDLYTLAEDSGSISPATSSAGILGNDNPSTGLTVVQTSANPGHGSFSINTTGPLAGTFTFTPDENFAGNVTFKYKAKDATNTLSNEATVTLRITAVNDDPTAADDGSATSPLNTNENTSLNIAVLANDTPGPVGTDEDTQTLTTTAVTNPPHGPV